MSAFTSLSPRRRGQVGNGGGGPTPAIDPGRGGYEEINGDNLGGDLVEPMAMADWFREPQLYQVAGVYMATRLFVNLSQAYIPLYLQVRLLHLDL